MRMDLGLSQTIKQIQTLSPQMYMSMEILCLNSLDLEDRIETELENNVALELKEPQKDGEEASPTESPEAAEDPYGSDATFDGKVEQWDQLAREEYDGGPARRSSYAGEKDDKLEALNNTEGRPMSLAEHLEEQVHLLSAEDFVEAGVEPEEIPLVRELCVEVLYNLDDRGYLLYPIEEIHRSLVERLNSGEIDVGGRVDGEGDGGGGGREPGEPVAGEGQGAPPPPADALALGPLGGEVRAEGAVARPFPGSARAAATAPGTEDTTAVAADEEARIPLELMRKALRVVQRLDPPGLGGLDLKECLLLQLERDVQKYPIEVQIIENHLDDLANNRLPKIAKALGIGIEDVKSAAETITSLNPIPGKLFGGDQPHYIKPDVVVEEVDGRLDVQVASDYLPRLRISDYYLDLYKRSRKDPELKKFIKKKLESAEWLLAAIRQRQSTLERIAREIVAIQSEFFTHGISHLKPLKMVDVADRVGVHVSTISRAISGKYMQTPQGIYEMKFFFTGGAQKSDGTMEARGSVIQRIKDLIEKEDKSSPLSDIDIVKLLAQSGIKISRRTVTKYREAENIPSSRQRRAY